MSFRWAVYIYLYFERNTASRFSLVMPSTASTPIHHGVAASLHPLCHRLHPMQNDVGDPGYVSCFLGPFISPGLARDFLVFPFWVGQKRGPPSPVTARYVGRPHAGRARSGRLIDAFQRSTLRSGTASLAMVRDPSLSGIADICSDSRVILGVLPGVRHPRPYL